MRGRGTRYVPIEISEEALEAAAQELCTDYEWLAIDGLVGDFLRDLGKVPRRGRRLVSFLGSTIGNFAIESRSLFFREIHEMLDPGDAFLLGLDLVKDLDTLLNANDDESGTTADFNRNLLRVINRELDADFPVEDFEQVVKWNEQHRCTEMWLRSTRRLEVKIGGLHSTVFLESGEETHTEISCKFRRSDVEEAFEAAGMRVSQWLTDPQERFALALGTPA